jgi:hypothetical protein
LVIGRHGALVILIMAALATAGLGAFRPAAAATETSRNMVYKVTHSSYGEIGTYANLVQTNGDTTTVTTTVHLVVKVLGIVMHREDDQRTEQWKNNRLIAFHGVTDKNGDTIVVNGRANDSDDAFIINTPSGTYAAPASVHPANPWSAASLQSTTMMQVDTGKVGPVQVRGGGETTIDIDGTKVAAREYDIDGAKRSRVWINQQGVPVKFTVDDDSGVVSFTLVR